MVISCSTTLTRLWDDRFILRNFNIPGNKKAHNSVAEIFKWFILCKTSLPTTTSADGRKYSCFYLTGGLFVHRW